MTWDKHAVCPCGWHTEAAFGSIFHVHDSCCPRCGSEKDTWRVVRMRYVVELLGVWYNPWSWDSNSRWEVHDDDREDPVPKRELRPVRSHRDPRNDVREVELDGI